MYLVKNITDPLKAFNGESIKDMKGNELHIKEVLTNQLGSYSGKGVTGDKLIKAYDLGLKIYGSKTEVELDDEQIKFIKSVLEANPMYTSIVVGQVLTILENSKKSEKKSDKEEVPANK